MPRVTRLDAGEPALDLRFPHGQPASKGIILTLHLCFRNYVPGTPPSQGSLRPCQGVCDTKTIFTVIARHHLLSHAHSQARGEGMSKTILRLLLFFFVWESSYFSLYLRYYAMNLLLFLFIPLFFLPSHPRHMEVPRLRVKSELQLPAHTTARATRDLSCICNLRHSLTQCWILSPLREARDRTCILRETMSSP